MTDDTHVIDSFAHNADILEVICVNNHPDLCYYLKFHYYEGMMYIDFKTRKTKDYNMILGVFTLVTRALLYNKDKEAIEIIKTFS